MMSTGDDSWKAAQGTTFRSGETGLAPQLKRGESVESLLAAVLEGLDVGEVPYLVMRNHQGYPEKITGDVDIVVCKSDLARGREVIVACARAVGWEIFLEARRPYLAYIGLTSARFPKRFALVVELFAGGTYYWMPFLRAPAALSRRARSGVCWRACPGDQATMTLAHYLLWNSRVPVKYRAELADLVAADRVRMSANLQNTFGRKAGDWILRLLESGDWTVLEGAARSLRVRFCFRQLGLHPFEFFGGLINTLTRSHMGPVNRQILIEAGTQEELDSLCRELLGIAEEWHLFLPGGRLVAEWPLEAPCPSPSGRSGGFCLLRRCSASWQETTPVRVSLRQGTSWHAMDITEAPTMRGMASAAWQAILLSIAVECGATLALPRGGGHA